MVRFGNKQLKIKRTFRNKNYIGLVRKTRAFRKLISEVPVFIPKV